jgi:hypothetical protein
MVLVFLVKGLTIAPIMYLDKKANRSAMTTIPPATNHLINGSLDVKKSNDIMKSFSKEKRLPQEGVFLITCN